MAKTQGDKAAESAIEKAIKDVKNKMAKQNKDAEDGTNIQEEEEEEEEEDGKGMRLFIFIFINYYDFFKIFSWGFAMFFHHFMCILCDCMFVSV